MLEVTDLACRRGERDLFSGLGFQLPAQTLLHVRGRNGSGKTTLLRVLCGLLRPDAGQIRWRGEHIRDLAEDYNRDLLYFGHLNGIKADLSGLENLRIASTLDQDPVDEAAILAALARIGLAGFEDLPTRMLSQGQKKRVALARLILSKAPLWILDEPFTALDVDAVEFLQQLISAQVADGGSVVLTTHQEVPLTRGAIQRLTLGEAVDDLDTSSAASAPAPCAPDPSASAH
ncbi:cytochrome c biogenesis heme-transporting ATPase CcmA [Halochromatium salexigens]|uniref:Heme ABC exporter ATP-binding protein CcmA n=1 Tax=Halochromatium salexigens TaxID=49447 RepID=A0AAJ0UH19_HALSE|nr:cytochrome c biogenesis heme-transporting ATPase CcmA [Halochromatium salexigens]MBK5931329.1 heme ABC exporter ATP-binding protein CcmA [Halochromatium salexigens]